MLSTQLSKKSFWENDVEGSIFLLKEGLTQLTDLSPLSVIEQHTFPHLREVLKKHQFDGKRGQVCVLTGHHNNKLSQFIFVGLGKVDQAWNIELDYLRRAVATTVQLMKKYELKNAAVALPDAEYFKVSSHELLKQLVVAAHMASYEFSTFKTERKNKDWSTDLTFVTPNSNDAGYASALHEATVIGQAINRARHWADLPANHLTPVKLSEEAAALAKRNNLPCTIMTPAQARELGMGAFYSVQQGSENEGRFVAIEYKGGGSNAPTIALCGKGVIFDTGGHNLKPTSGMSGMKFDMSGAAAVISMMEVFATLKPKINVIGITPLVENMPGGKASRPDDIVTAMNGVTIEIANTDAEGRLILSDALSYAEKEYNPDVIIDIATLTGAVQHALGHFYTAVMTKDQALADRLLELGKTTGDRTWQLPLDDDFKEAIKSQVADIHNNGSSSYYAGTITAACFLANFVKKARWAHLDIAGTAHDVPGINYLGKGATGAGIRLLTEFVMNYK
jgi:leucyl aminopeptidase